MMSAEPFDPANPACWLARGRTPFHATAIATAWRNHPDPPADASSAFRMQRCRDRVLALRPIHEAIRIDAEHARVAANFAFAERHVDDIRYRTILVARDRHGLSWKEAVAFADGYYAARTGWSANPHGDAVQVDAYRRGFLEAGANPDDIFDTARRAFAASAPPPRAAEEPTQSRPLPSSWPAPSDAPLPVRWSERLLIIGSSADPALATLLIDEVRRHPGHAACCIITVDGERGDVGYLGTDTVRAPLADLIAGREFSDILVAASGADLALVDAEASTIPMCRTMERTRNSALQQRAHLWIWLARGLLPGEIRAAGHIRWGKCNPRPSGRLGEFTARYTGPAHPRGHGIRVEMADGSPACGYRTVQGQLLAPEQIISNRSNLRRAMTVMLRAFAAAIPLMTNEGTR